MDATSNRVQLTIGEIRVCVFEGLFTVAVTEEGWPR